jgi:hypothetical protein
MHVPRSLAAAITHQAFCDERSHFLQPASSKHLLKLPIIQDIGTLYVSAMPLFVK